MAQDDTSEWPISGMRVLDLSSEIAGPYCAKLLVDAGADVIKVESPRGDPLRRWTASGSEIPAGEDGALFQFLNASKRGLCLDLESETGRSELLDLAADVDIVIEDFGAGRAEVLGLGLAQLQSRNPGLCLVSISPWGGTGPWADRPATEFTLQAAIGCTAYRGLPDRDPVAAGGRIGEWAAGSFAAVGAMSAWLAAREGGAGQHVDVSTFESMILCLTVYHDLNGQWNEGPLGTSIEIPSIEPAADGWIGVCTITGQQWVDFCALIGRQDLAEDPSLLDAKIRMARIDEMQSIIHGWTKERTVDEIIELALLLRIPAAPVGNGQTLPEIDHMKARGVFEKSAGGFLQPRPPYRLHATSLRPLGAAPDLGADSDAIRAGGAFDSERPTERRSRAAKLPLAGLRVLDMTAFWAGPMATSYLSDMGADVVKVESIQRPDGMRFAGAVPNEQLWEWSPVFHGANTGKRDITLQLESERGLEILRRLIAGADVMIENFSARVMEKFGLGWEQVRELNPRLIMVRMPAFGLDGPWRDRPGFAMTVEQVSGLAWITGYHDMPLVVRGACDPIGGMHAVFALMMALEHRRRTGEGQLVEVPLVEVAMNLSAEQVIEYSAYGELLNRDENRGPVSAPQGVYTCARANRTPTQPDPADRDRIAIAIPSDGHWQSLRRVMGDPEWARAADLEHATGRRARHDEIDRHLGEWCAGLRLEDVGRLLREAGIPAEHVSNAHFLMPNPQLEHRCFFQRMQHPVTGDTRYPGVPMQFSALQRELHTAPPPTLGQHNEEVLRGELGLTEEEFEELRSDQIIGERPSFM